MIVSISISVSSEYTVHTSQSKPWIEPFFALLHHPPKGLIPATKPWQPTHPSLILSVPFDTAQ